MEANRFLLNAMGERKVSECALYYVKQRSSNLFIKVEMYSNGSFCFFCVLEHIFCISLNIHEFSSCNFTVYA